MVDNRSAGALGIAGSFNFKAGDTSGTANKMSEDKMGQGSEYASFSKNEDEDEKKPEEKFVDRSAQLNATLNSLAMANVANILKNIKKVKKDTTDTEAYNAMIDELTDIAPKNL